MESKPSVLVVDDEVTVCNSCMKTFTREGYDVDYALNGKEALTKIDVGKYDLVVTDLKMPKVDGLQLLRTVKKRWPEVSVIMITGYGTIRSAVEAMKLGAFDYISKPFTSEEIAGVAARALVLTKMRRDKTKPALYLPIIFQDFSREILDNMWCLPEHAWALCEDDGTVRIGLDALYGRLIGGEIAEIEFAQVGRQIRQGEACVVLVVKNATEYTSARTVRHNLWCPVGGMVIDINEELRQDPTVLAAHPYGQGWLIRVQPGELDRDLENLKRFSESIGGRIARKHLVSVNQ